MDDQTFQLYANYYKQQAGSGISGYQGVRYQRGSGFFGRLFSNAIFPFLKYLGKQALITGSDIANDMIEEKSSFKDAAKKRLSVAAKRVASDAFAEAKSRLQGGSGYKRQRTRRKRAVVKKKRKKLIKRGKRRKVKRKKAKKSKRKTRKLSKIKSEWF